MTEIVTQVTETIFFKNGPALQDEMSRLPRLDMIVGGLYFCDELIEELRAATLQLGIFIYEELSSKVIGVTGGFEEDTYIFLKRLGNDLCFKHLD